MKHFLVWTWFTFIALQFVSWPVKKQNLEASQIASHFQKDWNKLVSKNLVSGTMLIQQDGQEVFSQGSIEQVFSVGSISKSFVGYLYFEMSEGGFDINQPVCQWLKNFCVKPLNTITLAHLLKHKSGFKRDLSLFEFVKRSLKSHWILKEIDQLKLSSQDVNAKPGEKFEYSNFGYLVLSRVLEVVHEKSFALLIQDLAERKGLTNTSCFEKGQELQKNILIPFITASIPWIRSVDLYKYAGSGGIKSSAQDLLKWLEILESSGFYKANFAGDEVYSHGLVKSKKQSYQAYWHNGATLGVYAMMAFIPETKTRVVILTDNFKPIKQWALEVEDFESYFY